MNSSTVKALSEAIEKLGIEYTAEYSPLLRDHYRIIEEHGYNFVGVAIVDSKTAQFFDDEHLEGIATWHEIFMRDYPNARFFVHYNGNVTEIDRMEFFATLLDRKTLL
jgi:hypothetical protein